MNLVILCITLWKITPKLLKLLDINFCKIKFKKDLKKLDSLIQKSLKEKKIVACLVENKILETNKKKILKKKLCTDLDRETFIIDLLKVIKKDTKIVSTTGHTSRELMHVRKKEKLNKGKDFYMVGGTIGTNQATSTTDPWLVYIFVPILNLIISR